MITSSTPMRDRIPSSLASDCMIIHRHVFVRGEEDIEGDQVDLQDWIYPIA